MIKRYISQGCLTAARSEGTRLRRCSTRFIDGTLRDGDRKHRSISPRPVNSRKRADWFFFLYTIYVITSSDSVRCRFCRSSAKSVPVLATFWNRRAWWNTCPVTRCLRDGVWRSGNRIGSGSSTVDAGRTIAVVAEIPPHTSKRKR